MAHFANMYEVDLAKPSRPIALTQIAAEGENNAHQIGAFVYRDGEPVALGGQCTGLVIRPDGQTVPLTGVVTGNAAYVVLDQQCCAIPGPIQVAVNWVSDADVTTLIVGYTTVVNTTTGSYIQPSEPIPDLTQLLAEIDEMREATADANAAASKSVRYDVAQSMTDAEIIQARANIDAASTHQVVRHDVAQSLTAAQKSQARGNIDAAGIGQVVRHDAAQSLSDAQIIQARANIDAASGTEFADLANAFAAMEKQYADAGLWTAGAINSSTGASGSASDTRIRTAAANIGNNLKVVPANGYKFVLFIYDSGNTYLGCWDGATLKKSATWHETGVLLTRWRKDYYFRLVCAKTGDANISPSEGVNVTIWQSTDAALNSAGVPADAKAVGDMLAAGLMYRGILTLPYSLDGILVPGVYQWNMANVPEDSPVATNCILLVAGGSNSSLMQMIIPISRKGIYYRYRSNNEFGSWRHFAADNDTVTAKESLTDEDDLDDLNMAAAGVYYFASASLPSNAPANSGGVLLVLPASYSLGYYCIQIFTAPGQMAYRYRAYSGWSRWYWVAEDTPDRLPMTIVKGAWSKKGTISTRSVKAVCSDQVYETTPGCVLYVYLAPNWVYSIREGDSPDDLPDQTAHLSNAAEHIVTHRYAVIQFNLYDPSIEDYADATPADFVNSAVIRRSGAAIRESVKYDEYHDFPETQGQLNVISRAYQMTQLAFTTLETLPLHGGGSMVITPRDADPNTDIVGVPYSSMRETMASVPQATSLHTFMTAALNPNSYLYTRHYEGTAPGYDYNSRCYYGAVCSSMVAWCYGIEDAIPTTISFADYPGLEPLPQAQQNPQSLKLADMLNLAGEHIVIVTDIVRNYRGRVIRIEVSEAWKPLCRSVAYTPEEIVSRYFDEGYVAYRYARLSEVPYEPSPWVHVDSSERDEPVYSTALSPRKGDRANWDYGEDIEIDVLDAEGCTGYEVRDRDGGSVAAAGAIPSGGPIVLTGLAAGRYVATLTGGAAEPVPVYFNVMDESAVYGDLGGGTVRVRFTSNMGTPSAIYWCCNRVNKSDYKAVRAYHILSAAEIEAGQADIEEPSEHRSEDTDNGKWLMRMAYKSEFGLYATELVTVPVG